jgi:glyoxylase I family protein
MSLFIGIEHFAIASPDPKRLADWYVAHLEFEILFEYQGAYFVEAKNGGLIEIIPSTGERPVSEIKTPGMRHIAIAVPDFDAAFRFLKERDVVFLGEPYEGQGNRVVFFADADGNVVRLIQRGRPLRA